MRVDVVASRHLHPRRWRSGSRPSRTAHARLGQRRARRPDPSSRRARCARCGSSRAPRRRRSRSPAARCATRLAAVLLIAAEDVGVADVELGDHLADQVVQVAAGAAPGHEAPVLVAASPASRRRACPGRRTSRAGCARPRRRSARTPPRGRRAAHARARSTLPSPALAALPASTMPYWCRRRGRSASCRRRRGGSWRCRRSGRSVSCSSRS